MNAAPVYALSEPVAEAGAVVYWSLSGCPPLAAVREALAGAGVPEAELPGQPSPAVALHQATCETFKGCLVRPLPKGGLAVVEERETEDGSLEHRVLWHTFLHEGTPLVGVRQNQPWEESIPAGDRLAAAYAAAFDSCPAAHLSDWLVRRVQRMAGVSLRQRGSVYFLPPEGAREYRRLREALQAVAGTAYQLHAIPALRGDEAVEAVLAAVIAEAEAEAASMEEDLKQQLGARALENRQARCAAVEAKVSKYEALLQRSAGAVQQRLDDLRAQLTVAMLTVPKEER